jgi:glutamate 5-kinase
VDEKTHEPLLSTLSVIAETTVKLRRDGHRVIIVSSGAIGVALRLMDLSRRPKHLPQVQALAAIGQCKLMTLWDSLFGHLRQPVAQVLLTRTDIADRTQYLNAQNTFVELLQMGVVPIVNENDTISVTEIKFGDNDTLSAITAGMVQADYLFLMTDVDCLYDKNPRQHADAKAIEVVEDISVLEADTSSRGSALGTGGMSTKIVAARLATSAGVTTVITKSSKPGNIHAIVQYAEAQKAAAVASARSSVSIDRDHNVAATIETLDGVTLAEDSSNPSDIEVAPLHTRFLPDPHPIRDRHFWLLHGLAPHGTVYIDEGASNALADKAGLLPVGVVDVEGVFGQQEAVRIVAVSRKSYKPSDQIISHKKSLSRSHSSVNVTAPASTSTMYAISNSSTTSSLTAVDASEAATSESRAPLQHSTQPHEIGRMLVNYSSVEIKRIAGLQSTEITNVLGYADSEYVALRENIALLRKEKGASRPGTPGLESGLEKVSGMGVRV